MNCREKILSEDYMSILLDYVPEEANQEDEAFCYQQVDGTLGIYYLCLLYTSPSPRDCS